MYLTRRFSSPLRYPGGKALLTGFIKDLLTHNNLCDVSYYEPFAGGAGLAIALLEDECVNSVYINDLDYGIYSFWASLLYHHEEFMQMYKQSPVSMDTWYRTREIINAPEYHSIVDYGFSTFFQNRCNRSGIIHGGPIGGYEQTGSYSLGCRYGTKSLDSRLTFIAKNASRIHLYRLDAIDFLNSVVPHDRKNAFAFIDPPYYKKGHQLYLNHYNIEDHTILRDAICNTLSIPWVVTYDNTEQIRELYVDYEQIEYSLNYSVYKNHKGTELLFHSRDIILPPDAAGKSQYSTVC